MEPLRKYKTPKVKAKKHPYFLSNYIFNKNKNEKDYLSS